MLETQQRVCLGCGETKALAAFGVHPRGRHGRQARCRECYRVSKLRDTPRARHNAQVADLATLSLRRCIACTAIKPFGEFPANRSKRDGVDNTCRDCNRAACAARYADTSREVHNARGKAWRRANPERARENGRNVAAARRARLRGVPMGAVKASVVFQRDEGICGICGTAVDPADFHVDHVVPLARGGEHAYDNVQTAHPACNRVKGAK